MGLRQSSLVALVAACACTSAWAKTNPVVELAVSDDALTAIVAAACPIRQVLDGSAVGFPGVSKLEIELFDPSVHVTNAAVKVTMRYRARDTAGLLELTGVAKPDLRFVVLSDKGIIEARLSRLVVTLPGNFEVPFDAVVEPFTLPAIWPAPIEFNGKSMIAEITVTDVVPETGRALLRGGIVFRPRAR